MIRRMAKIGKNACTGCCQCAEACHEDAIVTADGKACPIRDGCCGLEWAVYTALERCGRPILLTVATISADSRIL